jgi:hypothetical protein
MWSPSGRPPSREVALFWPRHRTVRELWAARRSNVKIVTLSRCCHGQMERHLYRSLLFQTGCDGSKATGWIFFTGSHVL